MAKVARLADYRAKNSTHNLEDWQAAFIEYLESEEQGSKRRVLPLNKDARGALLLLGYEEKQGLDKSVIIGQRGPMTRRGVQSILDKYQGDLDDFSCHSLRHTFCKNLVDAGVSLEKIAALAGHDSLKTTRRYCEPSPHDLALVVELIGEED